MKKIFFTAIIFFSLITSIYAGMRCSTDAWGNTSCRGTGNDIGYNTRSSTDSWGNTTIRDNRGNSLRCSTDAWGNTNCR